MFSLLYADFGNVYLGKGISTLTNIQIDTIENDKQIISEKWIEESLPCQPNDSIFSYPYQWQTGYCERGDFNARRLLKQYIFVDPKTNLVIVQLCKKNYFIKFSWRDFYRELCDKINAL